MTTTFRRRAGLPRITVLLAATASVVIAACGSQPIVLPSRDFDRPTDLTFSCLKLEGEPGALKLEGRPMGECHPPGMADPLIGPSTIGARTRYLTLGFLPNTARGDLSVIDMSTCRADDTKCSPPGASLIDLEPGSVGFGGLPVGALPEMLTASQDGCRVVTANRGSCDLSLVDPSALTARHYGATGGPRIVETVQPQTASGQLLNLAPSEIAFLPQQTAGLEGAAICDPGGVAGTLAAPVGLPPATVESPASWRALVTFPSCDLVALLELPSGRIIDSVRLEATERDGAGNATKVQVVRTGAEPSCPRTDCGARAVATAANCPAPMPVTGIGGTTGAGGNGDDTPAATAALSSPGAGGQAGGDGQGGQSGQTPIGALACGLGTGPLAVRPSGNRAYVGASQAPFIASLAITADALTPAAEPTPLHDGARGSTRIRLSVDPYAYSVERNPADPTRPEYGRFVKRPTTALPLEFLYVIARDGSVRVLDVDAAKAAPTECELDLDPLDPRAQAFDSNVQIPCFPYGHPDNPRRRALPGAAGLRLPSAPVDIAFATLYTPELLTVETQPARRERVLNGAFGFVLTANGQMHIVNIDPEPVETAQIVLEEGAPRALRLPALPMPLTHTVRNQNVLTFTSGLSPTGGPPRLDAPPIGPAGGPNLRPVQARTTRMNATYVPRVSAWKALDLPTTPPPNTYVFFPDPTAVAPQVWTISWQGDLSGVRATGTVFDAEHATPERDTRLNLALSGPRAAVVDYGGAFCSTGALPGDILTMTGCLEDAECGPGLSCIRSTRIPQAVGAFRVGGLCVRRDRAEALSGGRCLRLLETYKRYEILQSSQSRLIVAPKKDEIPRPAYTNAMGELVTCEDRGSDDPNPDCVSPTDAASSSRFKCVAVAGRPSEPVRRCVQTCESDDECRIGNVCIDFDGTSYCAQAAPLDEECFEQLVPYKLSAGNAFLVQGSSSGRTEVIVESTEPDSPYDLDANPDPVCVFDAARLAQTPQLVSRIPFNAPMCPGEAPDPATDMGAPLRAYLEDLFTQPFPPSAPAPETRSLNPCFVRTGSAVNGFSAVFQNTQLKFILSDLNRPLENTTEIRFEAHGGYGSQQVVPAVDAAISLPARLLVGPVPALDVGATVDGGGTASLELPYLFIVDQRQISGARTTSRGQIMRVHPRADGIEPRLEGISASNRYFPIQ